MTTKSIGEAIRNEAHKKLMQGFTLKDYREVGGEETAIVEIADTSKEMKIEADEDRIFIYADGILHLWIELNGEDLIVHAYNKARDEPTSLRITDTAIEVMA